MAELYTGYTELPKMFSEMNNANALIAAREQQMVERAKAQQEQDQYNNALMQSLNMPQTGGVMPQRMGQPGILPTASPQQGFSQRSPQAPITEPGAGRFAKEQVDEQYARQQAQQVAQEKAYQAEALKAENYAKIMLDTISKKVQSPENSKKAVQTINKYFQQLSDRGNPYAPTQLPEDLELGKDYAEKAGKDREISIPATGEDIDRILKSENTSQDVKDNLGSWKKRLDKMKKEDRPLNFQLKYDKDGELVGVKDTYAPPSMKVTISGGGDSGGGKLGKFADDEYARYYNMGQKSEALPQRVRGTARANQQSRMDWDAGYNEWLKNRGKTGAQAGLEATESRGDMKAMEKLKVQANAIGGFEKGAANAMQIADKLNQEVSRGSFPGINSLSLALKYHTGDPSVKAFRNSVVTAMTEYMKVVTAGTNISSAELSVGAQQRAKELLDVADNPETFKKQFKVFMDEMKGKMMGVQDQRAQLSKEMDRGSTKKVSGAPTSRKALLEAYMKAHKNVPKDKIESSEAFKADLKRFGL